MVQIQPTRAGPHEGDAGRVGDPPHRSEVGEDVPERATRMHTLCREIMAPNNDRAGTFRNSFVDLNIKASRGRHGAERADPPTPGGSDVEGNAPAKKARGREVRGGRDPPTKNGLDKAEDHHRCIYCTRHHLKG